jgi:hypothetical protein
MNVALHPDTLYHVDCEPAEHLTYTFFSRHATHPHLVVIEWVNVTLMLLAN